MNWVKKNLPTIESILYEGQSCNTLPDLWHALHSSYNSAENKPINASFLNKTPQADQILQPPFSKQEFKDAIAKCSSSSTPGLDHISWRHLKSLITNDKCLLKIVQIANMCIDLEFWLSHFKSSNTVVIPKPNKNNYNSPNCSNPSFYSTPQENSLKKPSAIGFNSLTLTNSGVFGNDPQQMQEYTSLILSGLAGSDSAIRAFSSLISLNSFLLLTTNSSHYV